MTSNTSPEKPDWFQLIDGQSPSAQVKRVNKRLPALTALAAFAVIAAGSLFANSSQPLQVSESASSITKIDSTFGATNLSSSDLAQPPTLIADPTLKGGDDDEEEDEYDDDDEYEDEDEDEDEDE